METYLEIRNIYKLFPVNTLNNLSPQPLGNVAFVLSFSHRRNMTQAFQTSVSGYFFNYKSGTSKVLVIPSHTFILRLAPYCLIATNKILSVPPDPFFRASLRGGISMVACVKSYSPNAYADCLLVSSVINI